MYAFFAASYLIHQTKRSEEDKTLTYIFLLLMYVPDLKPYILLGQGSRGIIDDVSEAFETLREFLLLLVDYAQAKVYLICLLESGLHTHNLGECFLGVLERSIAIV